MQPGFVDFSNFAHGFGFANGDAISEAREFSKAHQVEFVRAVTQGGPCVTALETRCPIGH